ncbi:glycosyltransferase [Flavobacteriales bacterium]|nr:glycosyltransferase [Flavobacteriales bacterium]
MNQPTVSVIIPAFNAQKHISECIESVIDQTYPSFEIILVNDGSTDATTQILKKFNKSHSKVRVIDQANSGVSQARNKGIRCARGEFIAFVDSDDTVHPDYLSTLHQTIHGGDISIAGANNLHGDQSTTLRTETFEAKYKLSPYECLSEYMSGKWGFTLWNKLYKTSIINDAKIKFHSEIALGEDILFNIQYLNFCTRVNTSSSTIYNYRIHAKSATRASETKEKWHQFSLLIKAVDKLITNGDLHTKLRPILITSPIIHRAIPSLLQDISNDQHLTNPKQTLQDAINEIPQNWFYPGATKVSPFAWAYLALFSIGIKRPALKVWQRKIK